jgi:hypothetical protein
MRHITRAHYSTTTLHVSRLLTKTTCTTSSRLHLCSLTILVATQIARLIMWYHRQLTQSPRPCQYTVSFSSSYLQCTMPAIVFYARISSSSQSRTISLPAMVCSLSISPTLPSKLCWCNHITISKPFLCLTAASHVVALIRKPLLCKYSSISEWLLVTACAVSIGVSQLFGPERSFRIPCSDSHLTVSKCLWSTAC